MGGAVSGREPFHERDGVVSPRLPASGSTSFQCFTLSGSTALPRSCEALLQPDCTLSSTLLLCYRTVTQSIAINQHCACTTSSTTTAIWSTDGLIRLKLMLSQANFDRFHSPCLKNDVNVLPVGCHPRRRYKTLPK